MTAQTTQADLQDIDDCREVIEDQSSDDEPVIRSGLHALYSSRPKARNHSESCKKHEDSANGYDVTCSSGREVTSAGVDRRLWRVLVHPWW